ncbi:MAG: hypothetical protein D6698_09420, partial [Gammaproteobacteria bacterium]
MTERQYQGSIFELNTDQAQDLIAFLGQDTVLSQPEKDLLTALLDLCPLEEQGRVDSAQLGEHLGLKYHGLRKRLQSLLEHGFFVRSQFKSSGKRAQSLYTLILPKQLPVKAKDSSALQLPLFNEKVEQQLEELLQIKYKIDDFFCGFLFPALRYKGNSTSHQSLTVHFSQSEFTLTASAREGYSIASVSDLKYAIALLTLADAMIRARREEGSPIQNRFAVEIKQLLK